MNHNHPIRRLGALALNGATTARSHLPAANSALAGAIPAADPRCGGRDQRDFTRPRNTNCDIGAVER